MIVKEYLPHTTDIKITGARLLTMAEFEACKKMVPVSFNVNLWLMDAGDHKGEAAYVYTNNTANKSGMYVDYSLGVRPALEYDPSTADFKVGRSVEINGDTYTVVAEGLLWKDEMLPTMSPFRTDITASDCSQYEASDVKKVVDAWLEKEISLNKERNPEPVAEVINKSAQTTVAQELNPEEVLKQIEERMDEGLEEMLPDRMLFSDNFGKFMPSLAQIGSNYGLDTEELRFAYEELEKAKETKIFDPSASPLLYEKDTMEALVLAADLRFKDAFMDVFDQAYDKMLSKAPIVSQKTTVEDVERDIETDDVGTLE